MLRLQLARMDMYDFWSLMEALEIPNIGNPPAIPLPPIVPPDPVEVLSSLQQGDGRFTLDPMSGQVMQVRIPETVTERLIAQHQLGLGMGASAAGRPPTAQQEPHLEGGKTDQTGAPRQAVSESSK